MVSMVLRHVRQTLGSAAVDEVVRTARVPYTPDHLDDLGNWVWYEEAIRIFEAAAELTGDPAVGTRAGDPAELAHPDPGQDPADSR